MTGMPSLKPGAVIGPLELEPISRKTLALFAGASGDHQPTHIDIDAARAKGRPDVIAHGMLVMAYMSRLLTTIAPQDRLKSFSVRFVAMTPVHAMPSCTAQVHEIADGIAHLVLTAKLSDGTLVATGKAQFDM